MSMYATSSGVDSPSSVQLYTAVHTPGAAALQRSTLQSGWTTTTTDLVPPSLLQWDHPTLGFDMHHLEYNILNAQFDQEMQKHGNFNMLKYCFVNSPQCKQRRQYLKTASCTIWVSNIYCLTNTADFNSPSNTLVLLSFWLICHKTK